MMYDSNATGNYQVISYANNDSNYSSISNTWRKSACCGAKNFGTPCTDCPG